MTTTTPKQRSKNAERIRAYRERLKADPVKAAAEKRKRSYSSVKSFVKLHATIKELGEIRELAAERHKKLLADKKLLVDPSPLVRVQALRN